MFSSGKLGALCRKAAMRVVTNGVKSRFTSRETTWRSIWVSAAITQSGCPGLEQVGVVNGLAWTQRGGARSWRWRRAWCPAPARWSSPATWGVMKESAQAGLSYIRSRAAQLGIEADFYKTKDIHVHFPEGAVPKDGPSAGIAITTAMVSALTGAPVRREIAMTGEVTLRAECYPLAA